MPWIGVDPGARSTGIVVRDGRTLIAGTVTDCAETEPGTTRPGPVTMAAIEAAIRTLGADDGIPIAVEDAQAPNPHVRRKDGNSVIDPTDIIDTARIIGWLQRAFPGLTLIEPGGNGKQPLATYPRELVTDTERRNALRRPGGMLEPARHNEPQCHLRAAWDVAVQAPIKAQIVLRMAGKH